MTAIIPTLLTIIGIVVYLVNRRYEKNLEAYRDSLLSYHDDLQAYRDRLDAAQKKLRESAVGYNNLLYRTVDKLNALRLGQSVTVEVVQIDGFPKEDFSNETI